MKAIVTFRFEKNLKHNPKKKKEGICKVGLYCSDITGEHHSCIIEGKNKEEIKEKARKICNHITRLEILK